MATGEELGTLDFAWSSTAGARVDATRGKSSWSGVAISHVTVTVTISDPAGAIAGATESATASVTARTWTFAPPKPASASSGYGGGVSCFAAKNSAASANVLAVNDACGWSSRLSSWETMALAHEAAHAASGDRCLRSPKTATKIRELEAITGNDVDTVRDKLAGTWNDFWNKIVLPAFQGRLSTPTSPVFWEYRFNTSWNRHALLGGREGGTTNCR